MTIKRVLLLSEGFGSGHTQAAQAISMGLRQLSPHISTHVLELGTFLHPTLAPWIFSAYRKTVCIKPSLVGKLYRSYNKKSLNRLTSLVLHRIFYARSAAVIHQLKPDLIICTHPFPTVVVSRLKRAGLTVPLCTVITDYDIHSTWVDYAVNHYLVSTDDVKNKLIERGVLAEIIHVTGIPIHPNFWEVHNKDDLRKHFNLQNIPTVLIMGGGWGLIENEELLTYATQWREKIQLIFCTGSNEKALQKLAEDERFQHPNIHLFGFTNEIDKLMDVSDLLVTKPGGMTCTEAMSKGIQMLFFNPIPGQEEENCHYFVGNGLGEEIHSVETIATWFNRLTSERQTLLQSRIDQQQNVKYKPQFCTESIIELLHA